MFQRENFHFQFLGLWYDTVLGGIPGDEPFLHRTVQGTAEHQMDAVDGGGAYGEMIDAIMKVAEAKEGQ